MNAVVVWQRARVRKHRRAAAAQQTIVWRRHRVSKHQYGDDNRIRVSSVACRSPTGANVSAVLTYYT